MTAWRSALPLVFIAIFFTFEDFITVPSCVISDVGNAPGSTGTAANLKAMIVSDLLLKGYDSSYVDTIFRNIFISRFFRKSFEKLEPDMLVVLGDIMGKTTKLGNRDWPAALKQFYRVVGPLGGVQLVVGLGERDVGECHELDRDFVGKIARELPGLDRTGSASFKFENISFLLINSIPLLCNDNPLRFAVEKLIESESFDLRAQMKESPLLEAGVFDEMDRHSDGFPRLKTHPPSGTGPVLLLHFPLSRAARDYERSSILGENIQKFEHKFTSHADSDTIEAPSQLMQTLLLNETEYILQSLRPRLIFSAHRQHFDVYNHIDGLREVTVPAMTWALGGRPSFVFASFGENNTRVSNCSLAGEMHVLMSYFSLLILFLAVTLILRGSYSINLF